MPDILGLSSVALVCLFYLILTFKFTNISNIIFVALAVRVILLFIGQQIDLPDSTGDSENFEFYAWSYAQEGFFNLPIHCT